MDRSMMPVPSPFGPPQSPMGQMGQPPGAPMIGQPPSAVDIVQAMRDLVGTPIKQPEPIYPPGYKPPKKPDTEWVKSTAERVHEQNRLWRELIYRIQGWVRMEVTGAFQQDIAARQNGYQEEYISSGLADERNLIISKGAALKPSFRKRAYEEEDRGYSQRLEDAAVWLRDMERRKHAKTGNRPLEIDEWSFFVDYGLYCARDTLAPKDPKCPLKMTLINPAQVNPVWDHDGLKQVFRVYRETTERITAIYGDFNPTELKKLEDQVGKVGDSTEFNVVEYWDSWWRCVMIGDVVVMPVTAHKYGQNPYTVQYGGYGEPMMTRSPGQIARLRGSSQWFRSESSLADDRMYKAVPYLFYRIPTHDIFTSVMARLITAYKNAMNPAVIRYRSDAAAEKDMPQLDGSEGSQNEAMLGEEKIEAMPMANLPVADRLLAALEQDKRTGSAPPDMYGTNDKSNITGVAQAGANDAGQHLLFPTTKAYEMALAIRYEKCFTLMGNFGHMAQYGTGETKRKIMVPSTRRNSEKPAYEFDREIIDRVGPEIDVTFTKVDPRDWAALFAAGKNGVDSGFITRADIRALATGDHDFDKHTEEWAEENAIFGAYTLPEFQKINVTASIIASIKENKGRPDIQRHYEQMLQMWNQMTQPPQPQGMPGQPGMGGPPQGMPQPGGMPPQVMQGPSPPPPGSTVIPPGGGGATPGVPGQMSYPSLGSGPGSQGAPVGRPY